MTTMGIRPGDPVLVIVHRGPQQLVYNALVVGFSMDQRLAGTHGEPAIEACFVASRAEARFYAREGIFPVVSVSNVVHISHRDFAERSTRVGYEELPARTPGICRYCKCTARRACLGGCGWEDPECTLCSNQSCVAMFKADHPPRPLFKP